MLLCCNHVNNNHGICQCHAAEIVKDKKTLVLYNIVGIVVVKLCSSVASHMTRMKEMMELTSQTQSCSVKGIVHAKK